MSYKLPHFFHDIYVYSGLTKQITREACGICSIQNIFFVCIERLAKFVITHTREYIYRINSSKTSAVFDTEKEFLFSPEPLIKLWK